MQHHIKQQQQQQQKTSYSIQLIGSVYTCIFTSLMIVYSTVYSGADQRKHESSASTGLCAGNSPVTGEFHAQRASNAEFVSISWRHHDYFHKLTPASYGPLYEEWCLSWAIWQHIIQANEFRDCTGIDYLAMLGLKWIHVNERGIWWHSHFMI